MFKGRLLEVTRKKARLPNGYRLTLEVIKHPGAALIVPFLSRDKIILLRQFRPVINKYLYELPAGTLNKGESHLACARREIKEEAGYSARKFIRLGFIYPAPGYTTEKIVIYKAQGLKKTGVFTEKDEVITAQEVTKKEVARIFKSEELTDAKTICALAFCRWL